MRILFLEDESELNELATGQLEREGHTVVSVKSVAEAQSVMEREGTQIDCVITDHRLPDGFGVAFGVQCRVRYPDLVVGIVSGCLTRKDLELLGDYEVPYWVKPVLYSQVARELEILLPASHEQRSAEKKMMDAPVFVPEAAPRSSTLSGLLKRVIGRA